MDKKGIFSIERKGITENKENIFKCPSHPDRNVTNICINCDLEFCPVCVNDHYRLHLKNRDSPEIVSIYDFKQELMERISFSQNRLNLEKVKLKEIINF